MSGRGYKLRLVLIAGLALVTRAAFSMEPVESNQRAQLDESAKSDRLALTEPVANEPSTSHEHYWIISSRRSPQSLASVNSPVRLRYFDCCPNSEARQLKSPAEFRQSLDPNKPICLFVHGSFFSDRDAVVDAKKTYRWIRNASPDRELQFVYYTWPSQGRYSFIPNNPATSPVPQIDVGILGRRAEFNGFYLAQLIATMPSQAKICLVGHSHGTRIASSAMHLLAGGTVQNRRLPCENNATQRIRIIL